MAKSRKVARKSRTTKSAAKTSPKPEPAKAMRLTFSYDGDDVKLISQQRTAMVVPASDPVTGFKKQKGFWAELKNDSNKTLYRRVMHNPTRNDAEVFPDPDTPGQGISRAPAPKRKGVFVVVVPDTHKGNEVTLSRSAPETRGPAKGLRALAIKPATEILRFKLKK